MKTLLLTLIILLNLSAILSGKNHASCNEKEKIELIGDDKKTGERERGMTTLRQVNAYVCFITSSVEVELCNIGIATIYIMDSLGQVVCSEEINTAIPVVLNFALPIGYDSYIIEIESDRYYAKGFFNL